MNEREMEQVVGALHHYFDRARTADDAYNASISSADRERYGAQLLLMAPAVIVQKLRNAVMGQMLALRDDADADRELQAFGLYLIMAYCSLIKAYGMGGITTLAILGFLSETDEDMVALTACAFALLAQEAPPVLRMPFQSAVDILRNEFNKRYGTGCKIALAYALLKLGAKEPFRTFAIPHLIPSEHQKSLERMLGSRDKAEQQFIDALTLGSIIMEIASEGRALPPWKRWVRK